MSATVHVRRARIAEELGREGSLTVAELSERLDVSDMTIRRDIAELEREGVVTRFHGGAAIRSGRAYEPPYLVRESRAADAKKRIGARVAELIHDGESLALGYGTTVLAVARQLNNGNNLTVVSPSLRTVLELAHAPGIRVMVTGGVLRASEQSLWGREAERTFERHFVDTAVIGAAGIHPEFGVTEFHVDEFSVVQAMTAGARRVIAAIDGSKFGVVAFAHVLPVTQLDTIVTSDDADPAVVRELADRGVSMIVV